MPTFVVIATANKAELGQAVKTVAPDDFWELKNDTWFVYQAGVTSHQMADRLGINNATTGVGVVLPVSNYAGRANPDLWEWLKLRLARTT
jgi:hypothetical protein